MVLLFLAVPVAGSGAKAEGSRAATTLSIRVSDFVGRGRVADASVVVQKVGRGRTKGSGVARIRARDLAPGVYALKIRAKGFWPRKTWVRIDGSPRVRVRETLLPRGGPFDMGFFQLVGRAIDGVTARWEARPRVRLISQRLECLQGGAGPGCATWRATGTPVSASLQTMLQNVASEIISGLTSPLKGDSSLVLWTPQVGDLIDREELLAEGLITVVEHDVVTAHRIFPEYAGGDVIHTQVWLVPAPIGATPFLVSQTIAIALGYAGRLSVSTCDDLAARGLTTLLCESHAALLPSESDRLAGRALYSRPAGNRRPDQDPKPNP